MARQGILVEPYERLKLEQVERMHQASLAVLADPGILCFNRNAAEIFGDHGAEVLSIPQGNVACWLLKIPEKTISDALRAAPKVVKLGARDENNSLILDGREPRTGWTWTQRLLLASMTQALRQNSLCSEWRRAAWTG